jgi:hypothetical protein
LSPCFPDTFSSLQTHYINNPGSRRINKKIYRPGRPALQIWFLRWMPYFYTLLTHHLSVQYCSPVRSKELIAEIWRWARMALHKAEVSNIDQRCEQYGTDMPIAPRYKYCDSPPPARTCWEGLARFSLRISLRGSGTCKPGKKTQSMPAGCNKHCRVPAPDARILLRFHSNR